MQKKYRYILLDLDGTLIYSHPGIYSCIRYALESLGEKEPTDSQLRKCIGPSLMYSFTKTFGLSEERATLATAKYREKYSVTGVYENKPMEDVLEGLKALKNAGYRLAMATSKPKFYADIIADRWGFSEFLSVQVGSGLDGSFPTKSSVIAEVMRQFGASADECLMVGDRFHDNEGAVENGMDCALLRVGYAEEGEIEEVAPTYAFDGFADLTDFLLSIA